MILPPITRRAVVGSACIGVATSIASSRGRPRAWRRLAEDVRREMIWAWQNYAEHAWGKDQIKPISGGFESFPLKDQHLGLTLVEALDTLWVMGWRSSFRRASIG